MNFILILGRWNITQIQPNNDGTARKIRVKIRLNSNGILGIPSASTMEFHECKEEEAMSCEEQVPSNTSSESASPNPKKEKTSGESQPPIPESEKKPEGPKYKKILIEYPVQEEVLYSLNLDECIHVEVSKFFTTF